jgi:hypothetical protein
MKKITIAVEEYTAENLKDAMITKQGGSAKMFNDVSGNSKDGTSHELSLYLGVGDEAQTKIYNDFCEKFYGMKDDHENVIEFHNNYTSGTGIRTYGGYFNIAEPEDAITIKSSESDNKFRQGTWMKYEKYEIFFLQYTRGDASGVLGYIHNLGMTDEEFMEFATKLAEKTMTQNPMIEGVVPTDKFSSVDWNTEKRNKTLKEAEERKAKKEADAKVAEAQKEAKRKQKAKTDVELIKNTEVKEAETKAE